MTSNVYLNRHPGTVQTKGKQAQLAIESFKANGELEVYNQH